MRTSNALLGILNAITALLSLAILGGGVWLAVRHHTECSRLVQWPVIGLGAALLLLSLAGMVGAFGRVRCLLALYVVVVLLLALLLLAATVFTFVVTNKGAGHQVSGRGYKEYHLGDYSTWLQRHVVNRSSTWARIKSCLIDAEVCKSLNDAPLSSSRLQGNASALIASFYQRELSPIQSGCCKPPTACNFTYEGGSTWAALSNSTASDDADCSRWSSDASALCFDCDACRAGVLQEMKSNWKKVVIVNAGVLLLLIVILCLACCACANSRSSRKGFAGFYVKT